VGIQGKNRALFLVGTRVEKNFGGAIVNKKPILSINPNGDVDYPDAVFVEFGSVSLMLRESENGVNIDISQDIGESCSSIVNVDVTDMPDHEIECMVDRNIVRVVNDIGEVLQESE